MKAYEDDLLKLVIHDGFVVTRKGRNTYINGKYYYDIEDQDVAACYCAFAEDSDTVYIQYRRPRIALLWGHPYFKEVPKRKFDLKKYRNQKSVECIFDNKETFYCYKAMK